MPRRDLAIEIAASLGVDLKRLEPAERLHAAVVFTMDRQVTAMLRRCSPAVRGRIFPIGRFYADDGEGQDIAVYSRLARCVDAIARTLTPLPHVP